MTVAVPTQHQTSQSPAGVVGGKNLGRDQKGHPFSFQLPLEAWRCCSGR